MAKQLISSLVPIKGLTFFYIISVLLLWIYFAWDYSRSFLVFSSASDHHLFVLAILYIGTGMLLLTFFAVVGVWFYVYHDAGQRAMNQRLWTAIAIFTPNLLGIVIYLILRKPLLAECPGCKQQLEGNLMYCSHCGRQFKQTCSACHSMVEKEFLFCGSCGSSLSATAR
jgi:hypothetical protein